ncbi:MAG: carboxypeptidase-like regulatory domain-containing protein [Bacteroidota bacterium]
MSNYLKPFLFKNSTCYLVLLATCCFACTRKTYRTLPNGAVVISYKHNGSLVEEVKGFQTISPPELIPEPDSNEALVSGLVTDAYSNENLAFCLITLNGNKTQTAVSDLDGQYKLTIIPGEYTIKCDAMGRADSTRKITIKAREHIKINFYTGGGMLWCFGYAPGIWERIKMFPKRMYYWVFTPNK